MDIKSMLLNREQFFAPVIQEKSIKLLDKIEYIYYYNLKYEKKSHKTIK